MSSIAEMAILGQKLDSSEPRHKVNGQDLEAKHLIMQKVEAMNDNILYMVEADHPVTRKHGGLLKDARQVVNDDLKIFGLASLACLAVYVKYETLDILAQMILGFGLIFSIMGISALLHAILVFGCNQKYGAEKGWLQSQAWGVGKKAIYYAGEGDVKAFQFGAGGTVRVGDSEMVLMSKDDDVLARIRRPILKEFTLNDFLEDIKRRIG